MVNGERRIWRERDKGKEAIKWHRFALIGGMRSEVNSSVCARTCVRLPRRKEDYRPRTFTLFTWHFSFSLVPPIPRSLTQHASQLVRGGAGGSRRTPAHTRADPDRRALSHKCHRFPNAQWRPPCKRQIGVHIHTH